MGGCAKAQQNAQHFSEAMLKISPRGGQSAEDRGEEGDNARAKINFYDQSGNVLEDSDYSGFVPNPFSSYFVPVNSCWVSRVTSFIKPAAGFASCARANVWWLKHPAKMKNAAHFPRPFLSARRTLFARRPVTISFRRFRAVASILSASDV